MSNSSIFSSYSAMVSFVVLRKWAISLRSTSKSLFVSFKSCSSSKTLLLRLLSLSSNL